MRILINTLFRLSAYFSRLSWRSQVVIKNAAGSLAVRIFSMLIDFAKVPILLSFMDTSHYGVLITIVSIVMWTHQFDFGLGTGLRYKLTEALSLNNEERSRQLISTAYISMALIMLIVFLVFIPVIINIDWPQILNCEFATSYELTFCVFIVFLVLIIQFVLDLISIVLQSDQKTALSSIFKPLANILVFVLIFVLRDYYYNSLVVACLVLLVPVVVVMFLANLYLFHKRYNKIAPSFNDFRKDCIKDIFSLGVKFFVSELSSLIVFSTSGFLITHYINPEEAAVYNTAWTYFGLLVLLSNMVLQPMIVAITDAYVREDFKWIRNSFKTITFYSVMMSILSLFMLLIAPFAFHLWVGDKIIISTTLSVIMTIYFIFNIWVSPYKNFLSGVGKMNVTVLVSVFKILLFFPVAIYLIKHIGSPGLVMAILLINTLPNLFFSVIQYRLIISQRATGIWNQ